MKHVPLQWSDAHELAARRCFARSLDNLAVGVVVFALVPSGVIDRVPLYVLTMVLAGLMLVAETAQLAAWGTTLGKWLLALKMVGLPAGSERFGIAAQRSFMVWVLGEGCGVAFLPAVLGAVAARRLLDKGTTAWDERCSTSVELVKSD